MVLPSRSMARAAPSPRGALPLTPATVATANSLATSSHRLNSWAILSTWTLRRRHVVGTDGRMASK
jgi:hypothetical protein